MNHNVICNSQHSRYQFEYLAQSFLENISRHVKPNGILNDLYLPDGMLNVVSRLLLKSRGTCQKPDVASLMVKYLAWASSGRMSSRVLVYHWFLLVALFKSFGSRHSLRLPSSFITGIIELIHSVWSCTSVVMPHKSV